MPEDTLPSGEGKPSTKDNLEVHSGVAGDALGMHTVDVEEHRREEVGHGLAYVVVDNPPVGAAENKENHPWDMKDS